MCPTKAVLRFGEFELSVASAELRRSGMLVPLQTQPARVLGILASRAGELVTRDELRGQLWADGTFVDYEQGLNYCIRHIRVALGESAKTPRFIETLPRRGYRFIATVEAGPVGPHRVPAAPPNGLATPAATPFVVGSVAAIVPVLAIALHLAFGGESTRFCPLHAQVMNAARLVHDMTFAATGETSRHHQIACNALAMVHGWIF